MKNQKGVTLIALIITIIVMLILVVVTINIATTGQLVNKTVDAKTQTQAATQNELNETNSAGWGILEAVIQPETFTLGQSYPKLYFKEEPISFSEMNPEVFNLLNSQGNFAINADKISMWVSPMLSGWGSSSKNFVAQETEPTNPSLNDYWFNTSTNKVYKYTNNTWVEQVEPNVSANEVVPVISLEEDIPETANVEALGVYINSGNPLLMEWLEVDRSILVLIVGSNSYMYAWTDLGAENLNQMFGGTLNSEKGWNIITFNETGGLSSAIPTTYSEVATDLSTITNITFTNDAANQAKISYLGWFFRSTPW